MRILIVDDEPLARTRLRAQLGDLGYYDIVGEAADGAQAVARARELHPDLVLLDIRMPIMDGLEAARHLARLPTPPAVIFATAYDDHALAAFEACAVDYILKPIRLERLRLALQRVRPLAGSLSERLAAAGAGSLGRTHLSAMHKGEMHLIPITEVRYLRHEQKYTVVGCAEGELLIEDSLKSLEEEFPEAFLRVHRNALVTLAFITGLERDDVGNVVVCIHNSDQRMPVSRRLLGQVRKRLRDVGKAE